MEGGEYAEFLLGGCVPSWVGLTGVVAVLGLGVEQGLVLYWYPLLTELGVRLRFLWTRTLPGLKGGDRV